MADVEALRGCAPLMRLVSPKMDVDDIIVTHGDKTLHGLGCRRRLARRPGGVSAYAGVRALLHRPRRGERQPGMRHRHRHPRRAVRVAGARPGSEIIPDWASRSTSTGSPSRLWACSPTTRASRTRRSGSSRRSTRRKRRPAPPAAEAGAARQLGLRAQELHALHAAEHRLGALPGLPATPAASRTTGCPTSA